MQPRHAIPVHFTQNPSLETLPVANFQGVPVNADGGFINLEYPFYPYFKDVWKWQSGTKPFKAEKKRDPFRLPLIQDDGFLRHQRDCLVWLGHASFFLRLGGISFLIDPVLGDLNWLIRRFSALPVPVASFQNLDYILVSHDHRDHCDEKSLRTLAAQNPLATVLTGLKMAPLLQKWMPHHKIQEAGWYQKFDLKTTGTELWYLPTRHWCRRGLTDINTRLWGAFLFRSEGKTIYWGGDTGWGNHFATVREHFGAPDIHLAGVGAYQPEWFMHPSHLSPGDAAKAGQLLDSQLFIPMHYGTFDLSDEPIGDPVQVLNVLAQTDDFLKDRLRIPAVGEVIEI